MTKEEMKKRTKQFSLRIIKLVESLPKEKVANVIGNQLLRAGTSVGANYRAACRGRSKADFISKMGIVEEEADECIYWMELLVESKIIEYDRLESSIEAGPSREFYKEYSVLFGPENPTYVFASDELLFKNRNFAIGQLQMLDRGLPSVEVVPERDTEL